MSVNHDPQQREYQHLSQIADLQNATVLEIGAGDGRLTTKYAGMARHIIAIDMQPTTLQTAHEKLADVADFVAADALHMPFPSNHFDVALLAWSL